MKEGKIYLTPKEIQIKLGVSPSNLKKNRLSGNLKDVQWTPGKGKPYYELGEVKQLFYK